MSEEKRQLKEIKKICQKCEDIVCGGGDPCTAMTAFYDICDIVGVGVERRKKTHEWWLKEMERQKQERGQ